MKMITFFTNNSRVFFWKLQPFPNALKWLELHTMVGHIFLNMTSPQIPNNSLKPTHLNMENLSKHYKEIPLNLGDTLGYNGKATGNEYLSLVFYP